MYEVPSIFKYILANDSSVLVTIVLSFAANCVSVKLFRSSSFFNIYFTTPKYISIQHAFHDAIT